MRASVSLWSKEDPRAFSRDTPLVLLGQHSTSGRMTLGTLDRKKGVTFGNSRYWPGKPWDFQWEWTFMPTPKDFSSVYDDLLMRLSGTLGKVAV